MKYLIALLTAATGILHLLVGFNLLGGSAGGPTQWLLVANGVGYLVLLVLYWTSTGGRGMIRWILLAYTLITLIGYFVIGMGFAGGTIPLLIKAIELLLVIALLFDRGSDRVPAATAPTYTRAPSGVDATRSSVTDAGATVGTMASTAGAGVTTAAAGAAAATIATADEVADDLGDATRDATDYAGDAVIDVTDRAGYVGESVDDSINAVGGMTGDAVDYVDDKVDDAYDATADAAGDAYDATADFTGDVADGVSDAADAVVDTAGDAYDAAIDDVTRAGAAVDAAFDDASAGGEPTVEDIGREFDEYLRSFGPGSEFTKGVAYIEGIGADNVEKLQAAGINTVRDLLVNCSTRRGRKQASDLTGIAQSLILTWVNHIDLYRIKGVAHEYADLLEQSGVDTVVELAQRNPANLYKRMIDVNAEKSLVRRTPHASEVQSWVEQAKSLPRMIFY